MSKRNRNLKSPEVDRHSNPTRPYIGMAGPYYITGNQTVLGDPYLHNDGVWRNGTWIMENETIVWSGYYATREAAQAALDAALAAGNTPDKWIDPESN